MGVFSEMDMDRQGHTAPSTEVSAFSEEPEIMEVPKQDTSAPTPAMSPAPAFEDEVKQQSEAEAAPAILAKLNESGSSTSEQVTDDPAADVDEEAKRKAHEEAEAKRKAEWDAKQAAKKAAEQEKLDRLTAMSDDEVMDASAQRVGTDIERLTRRNMKDCIAEHIQTKCLDDPAFARCVMHPRKSMIHCIWYINRKAREFVEKEMEDSDIKPENGIYGSDVPDDLCYQWAEDYFNDPNAKEDQEKEEKFVPKPYVGGRSTAKKSKPKKETAKKPVDKKPVDKKKAVADVGEQISLLEVAG